VFCALEGIDGCGTSTHTRLLGGFLKHKGYDVFLTQEPTKSEIGNLVRHFLKKEDSHPSIDALLFAADRASHYHEEIKKKLKKNFIVISDRYIESSIVYQSVQSKEISQEWVESLNKFVGKPDLTIILDIDPKISLSRKTGEELEKFENINFLKKVREVYLQRAKKQNYYIVNSNDIIEIVQDRIQKLIIKHLNR